MASQHTQDSFGLTEFGYRQKLNRGSVHKLAMFCLSYAFISVLVGASTLTGFGIAEAGPAFWWTWVAATIGQLLVALVLAELAAEYPIAGSLYTWASRVTSPLLSWMSGWLVVLSWTVAVAAVALTWQLVLPQVSSSFQLVGDGSTATQLGQNAFLLGTIVVVLSTIINCLHVKVTAWLNTAAVALELVVGAALIVLLFSHAKRGLSVVTDTAGTGGLHHGGYAVALLIAVAAPGFVLYGFDSAGTLAEESANPRHEAPRAIVRSIIVAGIAGILLMLAVLMSVDKIDLSAIGTGGLAFVIKQQLGAGLGNAFLIAVAIAIFAAAVAIQHGAARLVFAMARDNNLPAGRILSRLTPRQSPAEASILVGVVSIALMAFNLVQSQVIAALSSVSVVLMYLAYLCVTGPLLRKRLRNQWPAPDAVGRKYFSLGRWGLPVNIIAVVWGAGVAFDLAWPWKDIYNAAPPYHWYLKYSAWLFVGVLVGAGALWFQTYQRHRTGVVQAHRADEPASRPPAMQAAGRADALGSSDGVALVERRSGLKQ